MLSFVLWYVAISLVGLFSFPLAFRLLPALEDRGYLLSRAFGLLIWGYIFWLLASLGIVKNDLGGLVFSLGIVIGLGIIVLRKLGWTELTEWWRAHRRVIITGETLFLVSFAGWAVVRAANPEILGTEKPMELAFINAILRSPNFPPRDPWLSGYAISYYYFGYVMVAMLAKLTAVPGSIAFNLGISLVFALSAIGAYGILYNLLSAYITKRGPSQPLSWSGLTYALLGPFFVLIVSNLEGFLEIMYARGLFWKPGEAGSLSSQLWTWLDIKDLNQPPVQPFTWMPTRFYWWWRASRVLQDYDLAGNWKEIIDEFPYFSYMLADLHPHVLAIPFALLAVAVILNLFFGGAQGAFRWLGLRLNLRAEAFLLAALVLGGMAFLNTWDFPIYVALCCGAYVLWRYSQEKGIKEKDETGFVAPPSSRSGLWREFLGLGFALGVTGILLYLPFYLGFSSQAGGILPNLIYPTRGIHLWVMFGSLLIPLISFLIYLWRNKEHAPIGKGLILSLGLVFGLWMTSLLFGRLIAGLPLIGEYYLSSLGAAGLLGSLFREAITRRFIALGWVTLLGILVFTIGLLWTQKQSGEKEEKGGEESLIHNFEEGPLKVPSSLVPSQVFTLLLILAGTILVLVPDFFFLRDQFGWRMNTIFKFYYQAWLLWGLAAAFGSIVLLHELRGVWAKVFNVGLVLIIAMALVYPVLSLWTKTNGFDPPSGFTLDGTTYLEASSPDDMAGIRWLKSASPGIVVEAVGPQYSEYARVSMLSGLPTVLGWPGHESQWRGGGQEMGNRQNDIETIYRSNDWNQVKELLDRYHVRYIYIGPLERSTYRVQENKFMRYLKPVFQQGGVTIYETPYELPAN